MFSMNCEALWGCGKGSGSVSRAQVVLCACGRLHHPSLHLTHPALPCGFCEPWGKSGYLSCGMGSNWCAQRKCMPCPSRKFQQRGGFLPTPALPSLQQSQLTTGGLRRLTLTSSNEEQRTFASKGGAKEYRKRAV